MKRIGIVYQAEYPWDVRVEKIHRTLSRQGFGVTIICRRSTASEEQHVVGMRQLMLPASIAALPLPFSPFWYRFIEQQVCDRRLDLLIVRDLALAALCILIGRRYRIPVVVDLAECYPELLRSMWKFSRQPLHKRVTHSPALADVLERWVAKRATHTFVMVDESAQRWNALGAPNSAITVVSNTPELSGEIPTAHTAHTDGVTKLCYIGWVTNGRGVEVVIDAMGMLAQQGIVDIEYHVAGNGDALERCRRIAAAAGVQDRVHLYGWVSRDRALQLVEMCEVGVIPHRKCSHWDNTVPNKLFDYMAAAKPVLASNAIPVARILREEQCGEVFDERDASSVVSALLRLRDSGHRHNLGSAGRSAVERRWNWTADAERMQSVLDALLVPLNTTERQP